MGRHVWSEEVKQEALGLLADPELSYYDVAKRTDVPVSTLHDWAAAAGLTGRSDRLADTEEARRFRSERIAVKRAVLAEKLLDHAESFADAAVNLAEGAIEVKEGIFISTGKDASALMQAFKAAMDAHRLEMGEATSRVETRNPDSAQVAKAKVDELAERRTKKTA